LLQITSKQIVTCNIRSNKVKQKGTVKLTVGDIFVTVGIFPANACYMHILA